MADRAETKFHFSPRPNRAHEIAWRQWSPEAFQEAQRQDKPILLALSAVWCHWCHVMDETSYSDEQIITYINEHYVPIRVDSDRRPDINARYNMGGWPTTAVLTPDGEVLAGGTYLPPEQLRQLLSQVVEIYKESREEILQDAQEARQERATVVAAQRAPLEPDIFDNVLRAVAQDYDPVFGGFGDAPKFPHTDAIDLLLYAYHKQRDPDLLYMASKTLESMAKGGIFDQDWGGFFRYATHRDWSEPHYEKMLEDNANLLQSVLDLYRASKDGAHADIARRIIEYLDAKLSDRARGCFYGSQAADEEFYRLPPAERKRRPQPYIDRTCYTSWNAMAASAYLKASWVLAWPELQKRAIKALAFAWNHCRHAEKGMYRFNDGTPQVLGLLGDQAYMARALLDAHEVSTDPLYLKRAEELAKFILKRFVDMEGGFFDTWDADGDPRSARSENEEPGRLAERQKSIQENVVCAEIFLRLYALTRKEFYKKAAQASLEAFASTYHLLGFLAAAYAKAVDMFRGGLAQVNIVGDPSAEETQALHAAALSLDVPARTVQVLDPKRDGKRLEVLVLPQEFAPVAYVCLGTVCSAPLGSPEAIAETAREMQTFSRALG